MFLGKNANGSNRTDVLAHSVLGEICRRCYRPQCRLTGAGFILTRDTARRHSMGELGQFARDVRHLPTGAARGT